MRAFAPGTALAFFQERSFDFWRQSDLQALFDDLAGRRGRGDGSARDRDVIPEQPADNGGGKDTDTPSVSTFDLIATATPSDPFFSFQWHLVNTGQSGGTAGIDINVESVWDDYTGQGVTIGVVDTGLEYTHPDLAPNVNTTIDYDAATGDSDPLAESGENHSTAVSGSIVAEENNGLGLAGVAYDAQVASYRMTFGSGTEAQVQANLERQDQVDVSNHSWGYNGFFFDDLNSARFQGSGVAIRDAVMNGRGGLGTVFVFAGGNDREEGQNVNYHGFQNSPETIAVAALDRNGAIADFSTPGAALLVAAPGVQIATTDRVGNEGYVTGDYVSISGTSFATPITAGVVALMLEANGELGYRDVQEILAYSARQVNAGGSDWSLNGADTWNGGGLHVSHDYGFGLVDAHAAVRLAETWSAVSTYDNRSSVSSRSVPGLGIPDGGTVSDSITIASGLMIDHVVVNLDIVHPLIGDLIVTLTSPDGTESVLVSRPGKVPGSDDSDRGQVQSNIDFDMSSTHHWGETGEGTWTLTVTDAAGGSVGTLRDWTLTLIGDPIVDDDHYVFTDEFSAFAPASYELSDNAGTDTLNAAAVTSNSIIDLAAGAGNSIDGKSFSLGASTVIENAFAGDGNDTVRGNSADNHLSGGRGVDRLEGLGGRDTLEGGAGDDSLFGGSDEDVARFAGNRADYAVTEASGVTTVQDLNIVDGDDGRDQLTGIEVLRFADQDLLLDSGPPPNQAPTNITLGNSDVDENADGAVIGAVTVSDPDAGDSHVVTVDDARFEVVAGQLKLKAGVALDFETEPSVALSLTATDVGGLDVTRAVTVTVNDIFEAPPNQAPTNITLGNSDVDENASGAVIGTVNVSDPDAGDSHTVAVDDARFEVVAGQLKLKAGVALDFETEPSVALSLTATDAGGLEVTRAVTVTVNDLPETPANQAPTNITLGNSDVDENADGAVIGSVNVSDPDAGDSHVVTVDDTRFEVVAGQLKLKAGVALDFETEPSVSLSLTATDAGGLDVSRNVTVTVNDLPDDPPPPTGSSTLFVENFEGPIQYSVTGGGSARSTDFWSVMPTSGLSLGFTPGNLEGESFFAGRDLNGNFGGSSGSSAQRLLTFDEVDTSGATGVTIQIALAARPLTGSGTRFEAADYLAVQLSTDGGASFTEIDRFQGPASGSGALSNGSQALDGTFADFAYAVPDGAASVIVRVQALTSLGSETVVIDNLRITSGTGAIADEVPVLDTNAALTLDEGDSASLQGLLAASDADSDDAALLYSVTTAPANGTLLVGGVAAGSFTQAQLDAGQVSYRHDGGETVGDTFGFSLSDGSNVVTGQTFTIAVTPVNDLPLLDTALLDRTVDQGQAFNLGIAGNFSDADDALVFTASLLGGGDLPSWLNFNGTSGAFSGTPGNADVGTLDIEVTARDGSNETVSDIFQLTVDNVNDAPTVGTSISDQGADSGDAFNFTVPLSSFADIDSIHGDSLSISAVQADGSDLPTWLTFTPATRAFTGTPADGDAGLLTIRVIATDQGGLSVDQTFDLTVTGAPFVNTPPSVDQGIGDQTADEDAGFDFVVPADAFDDPDLGVGDALRYSATLDGGAALPAWLSFNPATRRFTGTPDNDDVDTLNVEVTVEDNSNASTSTVFSLQVRNVNDRPVVDRSIADQETEEDQALAFQVPADAFADDDSIHGDSLSYEATLANGDPLPAWLSFDPGTRSFSGTPEAGDIGALSIRVTATDEGGLDAFQDFVVTVNDVPDDPPPPTGGGALFVENFEGTTQFSVTGGGSRGSSDFWSVMPASGLSLGFTPGNIEGASYFAGRDLNGNFGGQSGSGAQRYLTFNEVNTATAAGVAIVIALAARPLTSSGTRFEAADFVSIQLSTDGGASFTEIDRFQGPNGGSGPLSNGSLDITDSFSDFSYAVPDSATSVIVRVQAMTSLGSESVAIDNLRITSGSGTAADQQPEALADDGSVLQGLLPSSDANSLDTLLANTGPAMQSGGDTETVERITGFTVDLSVAANNDVLDLGDLLTGAEAGDATLKFLVSDLDGDSDLDTQIRVGVGGQSGVTGTDAASALEIVLEDVDLFAAFGVAAGNHAALTDEMIANGNLIV